MIPKEDRTIGRGVKCLFPPAQCTSFLFNSRFNLKVESENSET